MCLLAATSHSAVRIYYNFGTGRSLFTTHACILPCYFVYYYYYFIYLPFLPLLLFLCLLHTLFTGDRDRDRMGQDSVDGSLVSHACLLPALFSFYALSACMPATFYSVLFALHVWLFVSFLPLKTLLPFQTYHHPAFLLPIQPV